MEKKMIFYLLSISLIFTIAISSRFINISKQGILVDETWVVPNPQLRFGEQSIFPKLFDYPQFHDLSQEMQGAIRKIYNWHPLMQVAAYQASDVHPPLFHMLNYYWGKWFGYEIGVVRVPAAIYFLLSVFYLFYTLIKQKVSPFTIIIALSFVVLSPFCLFFSNFARMYTLLILLTLISSYYSFSMVKNGFRWKVMCGYVLTASASMYTHYYGILVIATQIFYMVIEVWFFHHKKDLKKILILGAVSSFLYLPWLFVMIYQIKYRYPLLEQAFDYFDINALFMWILSFGPAYSRSTIYSGTNIILSFLMLFLFVGGFRYLWRNRNDMVCRFWLIFFSIPFLLIVVANIAKPVFTVRNCLIVFIPYMVICAFGFSNIKRRLYQISIAMVLGSVGIFYLFYGLSDGNINGPGAMEDWKSTGNLIRTLDKNLPVYVHRPSYRDPLYYYIPDENRIRGLPENLSKDGPEERSFYLVIAKTEAATLESKIEKELPFLIRYDSFIVKLLAQYPRIYIYKVERI